jgi:XTP/dITP diphosphohydrolase
MSVFVLATANEHKVIEMRAALANLDVELRPRPDDLAEIEETADTLEGNALLKARAVAAATGQAALADDTGLFVDALGGRPGVFSARYAGADATYADNVRRLLRELEGVEPARRRARFRTVVAVAYPSGESWWVEGVLEGEILTAPVGDGGFGYDPVFAPFGLDGRSLAQLTLEEKNALSHRGRALAAFAEVLRTS